MPQGLNPEVGYEFDAFRLNGGLDLTSPKIDAPKGTLLDVLNRDTIDRIGYRRINGFEPYDGRVSPAQVEYYLIQDDAYAGGTTSGYLTAFPPGSLLVVDDAPDTLFGIVVESFKTGDDLATIHYARISEDAEPSVGEVVNVHGASDDFNVSAKDVYSPIDALTTVNSYNALNTVLRDRITSLQNIPIGLHWFRDRLYSVVDDKSVYFTQSAGTAEIFVNSVISKDAGASTARVLDIKLTSGTWAGGNASGLMQIEVLTGTWATSGAVTVTNPSLATTFNLRAGAPTDPQPDYASLWRSLTEQQAITESGTAGWSRIDLGYEADFDSGLSDTDGLTVVNRGSENNFVFTSDSEEQLPVSILNGNDISGASFAPQSNASPGGSGSVSAGDPGWKTNALATDWALGSEILSAIDALDANYAYSNVFFNARSAFSSFPYGTLIAPDLQIAGPIAGYAGLTPQPSAVGTESFDTDFLTCNARAPIVLKDFSGVASVIPDGAIISGIQVEIPDYDVQSYVFGSFIADRNGTAGANIVTNTVTFLEDAFAWHACLCDINSTTSSALRGAVQTASLTFPTTAYQSSISASGGFDNFRMAATLVEQAATIGGDGNTFGAGSLTKGDLLDSNLGIALYANVSATPTYPIGMTTSGSLNETLDGCIRIKAYQVKVTFFYTVPSARYFVGDGAIAPANVCRVDVTYFVRSDGSWSAGTAEGSVQFTNIQPVTGGKRTVEPGDKFYLTQSDAENSTSPVINIVSSGTGAEYNGLPARNRLITNASRYQFITANFFGRDEWDGFYGVSGAGRAFSFATYDADGVTGNEDYLIQITTNTLDTEGDTPRHIAFHHYALALGYRSGIVRFSVPGEPENFDGVQGAAEVGVGDKVTGLLSMKGTVLGVYCENSIWGIAGTDVDNYQTQVLSPYNGAIEYSVVDMGIPVYCDNRGVSTLEQSEKYGNFAGRRLSYNVTPFILPRMVRNNAQFSGKGVVCAIPFRADNQYLVYFKDGRVLVMTMNPDGNPSFTYSTYYIGEGTSGNFLVPFAWSAQVDDQGIDRVHVSHFSTQSTVSDSDSLKVYEINRGWGFAGQPIPNHYTVNWYYKDPFTVTTLKKIRLDGLTQGISSCKVTLAKEYDTAFSTAFTDINLRVGQIGGTELYSTDLVPASVMANVTERGRSITFKVEGTNTAPIPPDIHQIILPHFDAGGKIDS
jgi:hypothetical protein